MRVDSDTGDHPAPTQADREFRSRGLWPASSRSAAMADLPPEAWPLRGSGRRTKEPLRRRPPPLGRVPLRLI
jgi:hypothetical protein